MRELAALLRPDTRRDRVRLLGGVLLAVGIFLMQIRKNDSWGDFTLFIVAVLPCAALYLLALVAARLGGPLERWQSTLLVSAVLLLFLTLARLADLLGANEDNTSSGTLTWVFASLAGVSAAVSVKLRSRVHTLIAAYFAAGAFIAFIDWVGAEAKASTFRDDFLVLAGLFAIAAYFLRRHRLDSDYLVLTACIAAVTAGAIGVGASLGSFLSDETSNPKGSDGWELFLLLASLASIGYTTWREYRATAYVGVIGLSLFVFLVGAQNDGEGGTVGGWPVLLTIVGIIAILLSILGPRIGFGGRGSPAVGSSEAPPPAPPTEPGPSGSIEPRV